MTHVSVFHAAIALVWMFLSGNTTLGGLATGWLAGFVLLALFRKVLNCEAYIRRVVSAATFAVRFLGQVLRANVHIARLALTRNAGEIEGRFLRYDIRGLSEFEVLLLCWCISLTPGTAVADKADADTLVLHAFGVGGPDEVRTHVDRDLKRHILEFTR